MVDYVKLKHNIDIPLKLFSPAKWKKATNENGQLYYWHTIRNVRLRYYTESQLFTINGKILMILHDTHVQNFDDIYGAERDLFLDDVNAVINRLFPSPILDIRNFEVTKIDYCVNVETPYVTEYISFLEKGFQMTNKGTRINHTERNNLSGSVYIKTAADYNANQNKNYTINFYDKADWAQKKRAEGHKISDADMFLAKDQLRLEVQCGHQMIKRQTEKFLITNTFGNLFDFKIAYDVIFTAYKLGFKGNENADFYSYTEAKKLLKGHPAAQKAIYVAASHKIMDSKYAYGRNQAKELGVYPHCFIDKNESIHYLENPIKLLNRKLSALGVLSE